MRNKGIYSASRVEALQQVVHYDREALEVSADLVADDRATGAPDWHELAWRPLQPSGMPRTTRNGDGGMIQ
jgi:hypothetical protein